MMSAEQTKLDLNSRSICIKCVSYHVCEINQTVLRNHHRVTITECWDYTIIKDKKEEQAPDREEIEETMRQYLKRNGEFKPIFPS